jgi:hypothetical protein
MPSFIDKLSNIDRYRQNDNDYRIEPYRLIDNQPGDIKEYVDYRQPDLQAKL